MIHVRHGMRLSSIVDLGLRSALLRLILLCSLVVRVPLVAAQTQDDSARDASARVLFEEGVQFAERGSWADAEDRFRRALSLRTSAVIAYNLASALVERGKLVEASETLHRVQVDDNADPALKRAGNALQVRLSKEIGRVAVTVRGWQPGDRAVLDSQILFNAQLGVEIPIDPGVHQLRLERAGSTVELKTLTIAASDRRRIELVAPAVVPNAAALAPAAAHGASALTDANSESAGITSTWWFWTGAVVILAAGASVAVVAATSGSPKPERAYQGNVPPGSIPIVVAP
ncbi:MAG: hypothetical protein RL701_231 [Pseudomonadota bacterium]